MFWYLFLDSTCEITAVRNCTGLIYGILGPLNFSSTKVLDKDSFASILFKNITVADHTPWYPPHWGLMRWVVGARSLWKRSSRPPPTPPRPAGPGPGSAACSQETLTPCSLPASRAPHHPGLSQENISWDAPLLIEVIYLTVKKCAVCLMLLFKKCLLVAPRYYFVKQYQWANRNSKHI